MGLRDINVIQQYDILKKKTPAWYWGMKMKNQSAPG
jgi:hypothetical protein